MYFSDLQTYFLIDKYKTGVLNLLMTLHLDKKLFDLKLVAKKITRSAKKLKRQEIKEIQTCLKHLTNQKSVGYTRKTRCATITRVWIC